MSKRCWAAAAVFTTFFCAVGATPQEQDQPPMHPTPSRAEGEGPFDRLVIRGATLIDGTGAPPRGPVDIVIEKNRITEVKNAGAPLAPIEDKKRPAAGNKEIDAAGMYVLPGFVDLHLHTGGVPKAPQPEYVYKL